MRFPVDPARHTQTSVVHRDHTKTYLCAHSRSVRATVNGANAAANRRLRTGLAGQVQGESRSIRQPYRLEYRSQLVGARLNLVQHNTSADLLKMLL